MKVVNKIDFRLVIEPESVPFLSEDKERAEWQREEECLNLRDEIGRKILNIKSMRVEHDTEEFCSFCNERWDEHEVGYPRCCSEAFTEWKKEKLSQEQS